MICDLDEVGLRMVDLELQNKVFKLAWAARIIKTKLAWGIIGKSYFAGFGGFEFLLRCNYNISKMDITITPFYKDILRFWKDLYNYEIPTNFQEVISETLWNNQNILVSGKSVCYNEWLNKGVQHIADLLDDKGKFISYEQFIGKHNIHVDLSLTLVLQMQFQKHGLT